MMIMVSITTAMMMMMMMMMMMICYTPILSYIRLILFYRVRGALHEHCSYDICILLQRKKNIFPSKSLLGGEVISNSWQGLFRISVHQITCMMTSSKGNIFHVTGPLCGEFAGNRRIPHKKASDAELWCFLWSAPEWINGWGNNHEAGDLRHRRAHFDVIVMCIWKFQWQFNFECLYSCTMHYL